MRWLTLTEVAEHLLGENPSTVRNQVAAGELDGLVTKKRGAQTRYHPEAAWYYACTGTFADTLDQAYDWAETHPLPKIPHGRGARLVASS